MLIGISNSASFNGLLKLLILSLILLALLLAITTPPAQSANIDSNGTSNATAFDTNSYWTQPTGANVTISPQSGQTYILGSVASRVNISGAVLYARIMRDGSEIGRYNLTSSPFESTNSFIINQTETAGTHQYGLEFYSTAGRKATVYRYSLNVLYLQTGTYLASVGDYVTNTTAQVNRSQVTGQEGVDTGQNTSITNLGTVNVAQNTSIDNLQANDTVDRAYVNSTKANKTDIGEFTGGTIGSGRYGTGIVRANISDYGLVNVSAGNNITITWTGCPSACIAQINSSGGGITSESDPFWGANYSTYLTHVSNTTAQVTIPQITELQAQQDAQNTTTAIANATANANANHTNLTNRSDVGSHPQLAIQNLYPDLHHKSPLVNQRPAAYNWTSRAASEASGWWSVTWSPELGLFVAVAYLGTNQVMTSPNGINWTSRSASEASYWRSVTWSPELGLFVAVATSGTNQVMTSPNGINWTSRSASEASYWWSVTWSPELGLFVAVAYSGTNRVMTSPDGINWTSRSASEASDWESVTWSPELGIFVAVADSGTNRVMTSPDGINWTSRAASEASDWESVTWSPELGIFVAVAESGTNRVMTSPDGITWTSRSASEASSWESVTWFPELGLFVAVARSGTNRVMTSPDGITWTSRSASEASDWYSVTWSPELGLFVAVAYDGTNRVMTSESISEYDRLGRKYLNNTFPGSSFITILGTIASGTWQGNVIADSYIDSASIWNSLWGKINGTNASIASLQDNDTTHDALLYNKTNAPTDHNGTSGQFLITNGDTTTSWTNVPPSGSAISYFLHNNSASGLSYSSKEMNRTFNTSSPLQFINVSTLSNGNTFIMNWTTPSLNLTLIPGGVHTAHLNVLKTGGASKTVKLYYECIYVTSDGGNRTIGGTSALSNEILTTDTELDMNLVMSDVHVNSTDKMLIRVYANQIGTSTGASLVLKIDNMTDSRLILPDIPTDLTPIINDISTANGTANTANATATNANSINSRRRSIGWAFNYSTNITIGNKTGIKVPYNGTIESISIMNVNGETGNLNLSIFNNSYANTPSLTNPLNPSPILITNSNKMENVTLAGWTTRVQAGYYLTPYVYSADGLKSAGIQFMILVD